MEAEVKERLGGEERERARERAREGGMGKDATRRAKKKAGSASFLKTIKAWMGFALKQGSTCQAKARMWQ